MSSLSSPNGNAPPPSERPAPSSAEGAQLVPVFVPALGSLLLSLEERKGSPLTEDEVKDARDKAVCVMLRLSASKQLDEKRGYRDLDPENVWLEWLAFRTEAQGSAF